MTPLRRLRVSPELSQFLCHLPPLIKKRIRAGLQAILEDPHEGKPLRAELSGLWSLPVGRFRIIYRPHEKWIEVATVGPRSSVYQELARRLMRERGGRPS